MNLLNGIKLFGRPLKIQFRSGSSHGSQDGKSPVSLQNSMCTPSPSSTPSSIPNRFDRSIGGQSPTGFLTPQMQAPRSFSSPDSLQRQAMMNSHNIRQQQFSSMDSPMLQAHLDFPSPILPSQGPSPSNFHSGPLSSDQASGQRKNRPRSHPYQQEGRQFSPEQRYGESSSDHMYRGGRDDYHDDRSADRAFRGSRDDYDRSFRGNRNDYLEEQSSDRPFRGNRDEFGDRSPSSWGRDYNPRRESPRDGRWCNRQ
ncbi:RNA-binding protein 7 [Protopterus annectens]|uniref:RNA-binding protein 7 n=1 Tax=Protopterus annectens TaxID=7888 RepID=UPI001CF9A06C|nr:RNA-binding protein 7 [Protopterus annectens]